jgi:RimJ/RimL family protein N-acetyltransferase
MLQHAYGHAQRVWFHVGTNNLRSRRAMEKIGAQFSHAIVVPNAAGIPRDMVVYSMQPPQLP